MNLKLAPHKLNKLKISSASITVFIYFIRNVSQFGDIISYTLFNTTRLLTC